MKKAGKKICSLLLAVVSFMAAPVTASAVVDIGTPSSSHPAVDVSKGMVYYGGALYRVVQNDGATMTLFMDGDIGNRVYDSSTHQSWSGSEICNYLNTTFLTGTFSTAEQAAIPAYGGTSVVDSVNGVTIDESQKIVLPSYAEVTSTWGMNLSYRTYSLNWWLRSPSYNDNIAAVVLSNGNVNPGVSADSFVDNPYAIRPAFKLNLSSVLFTSAASGGKGAVGTPSLSAAQQPTGAVKLTVISDYDASTNPDGLSLSTTTTAVSAQSGTTVSIPYTGAQTGAGRSVSVAICSQTTGEVLFYGRPVDCASGNASGTASFTLPAEGDLSAGTYTLRVFNEEEHSTNLTDYASTPVDITLTVDNTKPAVTGVSPSGSGIAITASTLSVTFDEVMNSAAGTVSLVPSTGTAPTVTFVGWDTDGRTANFSLSGLASNTTYSYHISGFTDTVGNTMEAVTSGYSFTTAAPAPVLLATPASLNFPSQTFGTTSTVQTITVTGTNLTGDIVVGTPTDAAFTVTKVSGWNNRTGGTLTIAFTPTAAQSYSGTLTISSPSAADVVVNLSGTGVAAPTADATQNTVTAPATVTAGTAFTITAIGHRQSAAGTQVGETRYIPASWSVNPSGNFPAGGPYTASVTIADTGSYTLTASYRLESWDGTQWTDTGTTDTKTADITVTAATTTSTEPTTTTTMGGSPQTGDDSNMWLWVAVLIASLLMAGLAAWQYIRQRRRGTKG